MVSKCGEQRYPKPICAISVSYTHLDVYKRQPVGVTVIPSSTYYSVVNVYFADSGNNIIRTFSSPRTAGPTFSPIPATYATAQTVTISDIIPGATIYYTCLLYTSRCV